MSVFPTKSLSSVCDISMGQAPKGDSYNTKRRGYPLIAGAGDFGELSPAPKKYTDSPTKLSKPGDLILCIRATIGDRNWSDMEYCLGRGVAGLRAKDTELCQAYLGHWLDHATPVLRSRGRGATFLQVSKRDIASLQIPLPPFAVQKRIARIMDAADALRAKRHDALAELDTLLQSTFLDMFGDPVTNPLGWRVGRLVDYFSKTRAGTCCGPFGSALKKREYVEDGIPVWGIDNIKPNQFIQDRSLFITPAKFAQLRRYSVESGDILISRAGTVGRMCVAVPTVEQSIIGSNLIRLTLNPDAMSPVFFASLYTFCGERLPGLRSSGDERSYSFLNTTRVKSLIVPVPPLDLQLHFAAIVESVEQQKTRQRAHLADLNTLFASLQSRAFRGDL